MKRTSSLTSIAPTSRAKKFNKLTALISLLLYVTFIVTACSVTPTPVPVETQTEVPIEETAPEETKEEVAEEATEEVSPEEAPEPFERLFGAYTYGGVWSGLNPILELESDLGQRLDVVHWFMGWNNDWDSSLVASAAQNGRLPMISWEPTTTTIQKIAAGEKDAYIQSWALGAKAYGETVYIRPFPEMNGYWTPWNGDTETFKRAWRRTVDIFKVSGADNVKWVWAPNVTDEPRIESNRMEHYYPGEYYVDILALDGYNWGNTRAYTEWQSFEEVFTEPYERIAKLGSQPIWLAEVASAEIGGDKAAWINDMFTSTAFPRIQAMIWFDEDKEAAWHMNSSAQALAAFQSSLANDIQFAGLGQ